MALLSSPASATPEPDYAETRHNAGFRFLDALLSGTGERLRHEAKFGGDLARVTIAGQPVWLLAPTEFMNHSGRALSRFAQFYKIAPAQMLVVHDELDLPPGGRAAQDGRWGRWPQRPDRHH